MSRSSTTARAVLFAGLLALQALASAGHLQRTYTAALQQRYLWHEFGDLHLILP